MKTSKKAIIVAMATIAHVSATEMQAAMQAAAEDMKKDGTVMNYTWNPFDGMLA